MPLNIPESPTVVFNRMAIDISQELEELDPFLRVHWARALTVSYANAVYEWYKSLLQLKNLFFWNTTSGEELEIWASIFGITRNPATISKGRVTFTGIAATNIPASSVFTSESGDFYETTELVQIQNTNLSVTSMTRSGTIVTVLTAVTHGLASGMGVTISGANETEYNGLHTISVTGTQSFTFTIASTPTTPATGTILANATYANASSQSIEFGESQNLSSGTSVSLSPPIAGVDDQGTVSFDELSGGADEESDTSLRDRFLFRVQNPIALFTKEAIESAARMVPGVTRVWIQNVDDLRDSVPAVSLTAVSGNIGIFTTSLPHGLFDGQPISILGAEQLGYNVFNKKILKKDDNSFIVTLDGTPISPATGDISANFSVSGLGQVRVFFTLDNNQNIIPTPTDTTNVSNEIKKIQPATVSDTDVLVLAPQAINVDFAFSSISPDTPEMRTAIQNNLTQYFSTSTNVGFDLSKKEYEGLIISTIDDTGEKLVDFELTTPTNDINIGPSDLPVIGTVTFP